MLQKWIFKNISIAAFKIWVFMLRSPERSQLRTSIESKREGFLVECDNEDQEMQMFPFSSKQTLKKNIS